MAQKKEEKMNSERRRGERKRVQGTPTIFYSVVNGLQGKMCRVVFERNCFSTINHQPCRGREEKGEEEKEMRDSTSLGFRRGWISR